MLNLHQAWQKPIAQILRENVLFFGPAFRPLGTLVYRALYWLAGFHALPFRIAAFALIFFNLYLLHRTSAAISTKEVGLLSALLACYNAGVVGLYYNTGTIYDLLCFTFYFLALDLFIAVRNEGQPLRPRQIVTLLLLYICALNSKEMAVTLPIVVAGYELILGRRGIRSIYRWLPCVLTAAVTAPYVIGKLHRSSQLVGNAAFRLQIDGLTYIKALAHYFAALSYSSRETFSVRKTVIILVVAALITLVLRERRMVFASFFTLVTVLPIAFVPLRTGYVMYIPVFGMALYFALLLVKVRERLTATTFNRQLVTFALCGTVLIRLHAARPLPGPSAADRLVKSTVAQLAQLRPKIDRNTRILFLEDPFQTDEYTPLFILRLYYGFPDLVVDRIKMFPTKLSQAQIDSYDILFTFDGPRLVCLRPQLPTH